MDNFYHIDCTLRDGGYYVNWDFSENLVQDYLNSLSGLNISFVELGFRYFENKGFKGPYAYCKEDFIDQLNVPKNIRIAVMLNGSDLIPNGNLDLDILEKLIPKSSRDSKVDLIRIACEFDTFKSIKQAFRIIHKKGYILGLNIMKISILSDKEIREIGSLANQLKLNVLYIADTFGSLNQYDTKRIIETLRETWNGEIGFHAHDNKGLANINSVEALKNGATWIDSTVLGMGRGAGNAKTEDLIMELYGDKLINNELIDLLKLIKKYFLDLKKIFCWGSNSYYYLSAKFSIHPSYIQNILSDKRFKEEDILSVISYLKTEDSTKFDINNLNNSLKFFRGYPKGRAKPSEIIKSDEVLIIGSGENLFLHKKALEDFILKKNLTVIALNEKSQVDEKLINFRIACNPIRLMADINIYLNSKIPLITPLSMLEKNLFNKLKNRNIIDYGIGINDSSFVFKKTYGLVPNLLVFSYALSFLGNTKVKNIYLAGFEGFHSNDLRNQEIEDTIKKFKNSIATCRLISITPTTFNSLESKSLYGFSL